MEMLIFEPMSPTIIFELGEKRKNKTDTRMPEDRGAWVAQSVERPTLAQVRISQFVSSSPVSGSVLTAQSLEPASDSVSPLSTQLVLCLSMSLKK